MTYKVECGGNLCFRVYQKKNIFIFTYWSYMCTESTVAAAGALINNLMLINKEGKQC